ncbi:MAG: NAD(P)/FAD-dependent oxidoreductase [Nitrospiraceae bacterium]|nr:NAD(P)/FAD-dependent oxidoreductase [Nitrospiraceae bacterium]
MMKCDVIVIGAGAAGLMCAIEAARRGRSVIVLEHGKPGRKVLASGGGRSNFTNLELGADNYLSENPDFTRSALAGFTPGDIIGFLESRGVPFAQKENGQLFLKGSSRALLELLLGKCRENGAAVITGINIKGFGKKAARFNVDTNKKVCFDSESLVVATGGLSYPELGATDLGYRIASRFGLRITPLRPALVPFTFAPEEAHRFSGLCGLSLQAEISCGGGKNKSKRTFTGDILFTHRGLSGPAALQASLYWAPGEELSIDLLPDADIKGMFMKDRGRSVEMQNYLSGFLPRRMALKWCGSFLSSSSKKPLRLHSQRELESAAEALHNWTFRPAGTEGYRTAEVTAGGVDTRELSSRTMECGKVPGLFFAGEVMDVTGQLGGYNLHWAWASGCAAGRYA